MIFYRDVSFISFQSYRINLKHIKKEGRGINFNRWSWNLILKFTSEEIVISVKTEDI